MIAAIIAKVGAATQVMPLLRSLGEWVKNASTRQREGSLVSFSKSTRVEPITLVDQRLVGRDDTTQLLNALSALFTAYYLQAAAMLATVKDVSTLKLLDAINPERDVYQAAAHGVDRLKDKAPGLLSYESYDYGLPVMENLPVPHGSVQSSGKLKSADSDKGSKDGLRVGTDVDSLLREAANLSVGRMIELTVSQGERSAKFPVMIRLLVNLIPSDILTHILGDGSRNSSAKEMWHKWRSKGGGFKNFMSDIVLAQDLIEEHRKTLMKDTTGTYDEILERRKKNRFATLATNQNSIAGSANLAVISGQTAKELEAHIGAKLDNFAARERVFKSSYVMILAVLDTDWDRVTFYHQGIKLPTQLSVKELKVSNKGSGPDVAEILKAYQLGSNPTL